MKASASAPAILTIDLTRLADNYKALAAMAPSAQCAAVVKADAYGIGVAQSVPALAGAGCSTFFVATLDEAKKVRIVAAGADIYVLDGLFPGCAPDFAEGAIRPALGSLPEIEEWAGFCSRDGRKLPAAIHIDTGMNRLGLQEEEVRQLAAEPTVFDAFEPVLVMSHLACGDDPQNPLNETQRGRFDGLRQLLPEMPACLANSAGVFLGPPYHYDMVRPGIALYGGRAVNDVENPMKPVVRLDARIAQIRKAQPGETVGYGATRTLDRPTTIATVSSGYADGIFRHLGAGDRQDGLVAWLDDHPAPVLGRVSMDTVTIDVTDIPEHLAVRGGLVEVLGPHVTVDDLADRAGTIGYEVLTSLGKRYERVYVGS